MTAAAAPSRPLPYPASRAEAGLDPAALEDVLRSPAPARFVARRVGQLIDFGHSPARDLERPLDRCVIEAKVRLGHALDRLGPESGDLAYALAKIEVAGACLLAAWDRIHAEMAKRGESDG